MKICLDFINSASLHCGLTTQIYGDLSKAWRPLQSNNFDFIQAIKKGLAWHFSFSNLWNILSPQRSIQFILHFKYQSPVCAGPHSWSHSCKWKSGRDAFNSCCGSHLLLLLQSVFRLKFDLAGWERGRVELSCCCLVPCLSLRCEGLPAWEQFANMSCWSWFWLVS